MSLGGSSPYTSTDKTIKINRHKRNNTKNTVQTVQNTVNKYKYTLTKHPLITKAPHTHTHPLQYKLKQP